jgi:ribosome-binding factor A
MGRRQLRVNEALREVISQHLAGELKDPRLGFVTVTGVETSPDLRYARVYVTVLGSAAEHESSLAALRAAHGFLQARVSHELRLRRTPQLEFIYDETTDRALRISGYLDDYLREHPEPPPDPNARENEEEGNDHGNAEAEKGRDEGTRPSEGAA